MQNEWLTPKEISERMKVDLEVIYKWIRNGDLKAYRMGEKLWRIAQSDFEEFLKRDGKPAS